MNVEEYQLGFWEEIHGANDIIFHVTYCTDGCPFNKVYRAKQETMNIYLQTFSSGSLQEPHKWLITVEQLFPRWESNTYAHYIEEDWMEAFAKIEDLTNKIPKFRLDEQANHPSMIGH